MSAENKWPSLVLHISKNLRVDLPFWTPNSRILTLLILDMRGYKKLFNRTPDEYELWFVTDMIQKDTALTAELIYFSLMTANEYRYY